MGAGFREMKEAGSKMEEYCNLITSYIGRVWTKGYDKRYCFSVKDLKIRIDYVLRQG
jgi:hypothetical protein